MMTLDEIAAELGVSRQMVYKIEQRALRKARVLLEKHNLTVEEWLDGLQTAPEGQNEDTEPRG